MDAGLEGEQASCYGVNLAFANFGVVVGFVHLLDQLH